MEFSPQRIETLTRISNVPNILLSPLNCFSACRIFACFTTSSLANQWCYKDAGTGPLQTSQTSGRVLPAQQAMWPGFRDCPRRSSRPSSSRWPWWPGSVGEHAVASPSGAPPAPGGRRPPSSCCSAGGTVGGAGATQCMVSDSLHHPICKHYSMTQGFS